MAIFPSMLITKQGQTLYNKAQAGTPINFTKIKIGSGRLSNEQDQTTLTKLIDYKFDVPISSITQNTQLQIAVISGRINNENITTGTYICELGLFAEDPDEGEILYSYTNAADEGDYYAPASRGPFTWAYQINASVGNAANVTATLVSNSTFDYAIDVSSNFTTIVGINQKEVNESIDSHFKKVNEQLADTVSKKYISGADFNTMKDVGVYGMHGTNINAPSNTSGNCYGGSYTLIVGNSNGNTSYVEQIAIQETYNKIFIRCYTPYGKEAHWTEWKELFTGKITYGTSEPSGGGSGDIYFQYE